MNKIKINSLAKKVWKYQFGDSNWGIDPFGLKVLKSAFGDKNSRFGWNIDHIIPLSGFAGVSGRDSIENMQVMNIFSNEQKANKRFGKFECCLIDKNSNIENMIKLNYEIFLNPFLPTKDNNKNGIYGIWLPREPSTLVYIYDSKLFYYSKYGNQWKFANLYLDEPYDLDIRVFRKFTGFSSLGFYFTSLPREFQKLKQSKNNDRWISIFELTKLDLENFETFEQEEFYK